MTYGILARHDGRITVESEDGAGPTFRITFASTGDAPPVRAVKALVPGLPVFLVTGFGVAQADLAGHAVDLVLAKPLQIRDVTAALARVTPRSGGQP